MKYFIGVIDKVDDAVVWSNTYDNRDYVAGVLTGGLLIVANSEKYTWFMFDDNVPIIPINFLQSNYLIYTDVPSQILNKFRSDNDTPVWWINSINQGNQIIPSNTYDLFQVSDDFIFGFIDIMEIFTEEFRNFVYASPFKITGDDIVTYNIEGYDLIPFNKFDKSDKSNKSDDRLAPVTPYYSYISENDYIPLVNDELYEGNINTT